MTTLLGRLTATIDGASVDIVDAATIAEYSVQADGFTLGAAIEKPLYSSSVQQGIVRVIGAAKGQREIRIPLLVTGADKAAVLASVDALVAVCDSVSRFGGGEYLHRASGASLPVRFRVASAMVGGVDSWGEFEAHSRARVSVSIVADTFARGAVYAVDDDFSTDTLGTGGVYNIGGADWEIVNGSEPFAITGGSLVTGDIAATQAVTHTGSGQAFGDVEVSAAFTFATLSANNMYAGFRIRSSIAGDWLRFVMLDNGTNSVGYIYTCPVGSCGNKANTGNVPTRITAGTKFWLVARVVGNVMQLEYWTVEPTPAGTPNDTIEYVMDATEIAAHGEDVTGNITLEWNTRAGGAITVDDFKVRPLTYDAVIFPEVLALKGAWGGTTDAQAAVIYTNASGGTAPTRMLYAWWGALWEQPNMINNGHFERDTSGWSIDIGPTGINNAAVSLTRTAGGNTGKYHANIITAGSIGSEGTRCLVFGKFKKGKIYTANVRIKSATSTSALFVGIGNSNSDKGQTTSAAMTADWQTFTTTWIPSADRDYAYVYVKHGAGAVASEWDIDDFTMFEGIAEPSFTAGAHGPNIIDAASADEETLGSAFAITADADYLNGYGVQSSGDLSTNGTLEYFLRPDLFPPNEYGCGEVDIAVYARVEIASTQSDVNCVLSIGPEGDSAHTLANQKYSEFYDDGKNLQEPVTSTTFQPVYLGTVTARVDRANPSRWKLRLAFVNNPASTGTLGVDYIVAVPAKNIASSQTGATDANVPAFIATTTPTTKRVNSDLSAVVSDPASQLGGGAIPDRGLLRNHIRIPKDGANLLVWPSDMQIDYPAVNSLSMAETFTGTVHVEIQPLHHVTKV